MKSRFRFSTLLSVVAILFSLANGGRGRAQDFHEKPQANKAEAEGKGIQTSPQAARQPLVTCSPDGEFYVSATPDGRIKYCRAQDGATFRTFYQCHPKSVAFSPDGSLLASTGQQSNGSPAKIKVWRLKGGELVCKIHTDLGSNPLLSFSPDGFLLVSTGEKSRVNLWQLPEGALKWSAPVDRAIAQVTFTNQGQAIVVVCADGTARRFEVK